MLSLRCVKWLYVIPMATSNDLYKLGVCVYLIFLSFHLVAFASAFSTVKSVFACSFFHRIDLLYPYQNEMWNENDAERQKEKDNIELAHHANMHYGWLQCEDEIPLSCRRLHAGIYHEMVVFDWMVATAVFMFIDDIIKYHARCRLEWSWASVFRI